MAKKVGIFSGKGVGKDPGDTIKSTIYITREDRRNVRRTLLTLEEEGIDVKFTEFARSAIRGALNRIESAPSFSTKEDLIDFLEK